MVTCVESIPKFAISSFSLPLQRVQRNTTPPFTMLHFEDQCFRLGVTESCVCLSVTGIMETDRQITNLQDAWCHSEQNTGGLYTVQWPIRGSSHAS